AIEKGRAARSIELPTSAVGAESASMFFVGLAPRQPRGDLRSPLGHATLWHECPRRGRSDSWISLASTMTTRLWMSGTFRACERVHRRTSSRRLEDSGAVNR